MASSSSNTSLPMHKNNLQEYAQKSGFQIPTYQTTNEGYAHAPKFRSTVLVDGTVYKSLLTFSNQKAAEQDAAKHALETITKKKEDEGFFLIHQDPTICKPILHEFAVKMRTKLPTYSITQSDDKCPVFVSSLVFGGKTYTGGTGRSKKEAEQLAARTAIQSLLGSDSRNLLNEIIKYKVNLYAAVPKSNDLGFSQSIVPIAVQLEDSSQDSSQHLNNVQAQFVGESANLKTTILKKIEVVGSKPTIFAISDFLSHHHFWFLLLRFAISNMFAAFFVRLDKLVSMPLYVSSYTLV